MKINQSQSKIEVSEKSTSHLNNDRSFNYNQNISSMTEVMFLPLGVPTFKPIPTISESSIRRSDMLLASGAADSASVTTLFKNQKNGTNVFATHDMMNSFTNFNAIQGGFKNITTNLEDVRENTNKDKIKDLSDMAYRKNKENTMNISNNNFKIILDEKWAALYTMQDALKMNGNLSD